MHVFSNFDMLDFRDHEAMIVVDWLLFILTKSVFLTRGEFELSCFLVSTAKCRNACSEMNILSFEDEIEKPTTTAVILQTNMVVD